MERYIGGGFGALESELEYPPISGSLEIVRKNLHIAFGGE